jgi:outer membrane protein OmpA-like peptidoglycan-associated protein
MATARTSIPIAAWLALLAAALAGCSTPPAPSGQPEPPSAAAPAPARPAAPPVAASPLERTQRWLDGFYKGTSVVAVLDDDGVLWLEVPLADAFDPGQTTIKPVLDLALQRLAASQQRLPGSRLRVAAPTDPGAGPALADRRAVQIRAHLAGRGVPMQVMRTVPARQSGQVELQLEVPPRGAP